MAYIIGKKVVKDTEDFDAYAYGITFPLRRGNTGYFEQAFTSYEQAKANLKNLLITKKGERVMQPRFGSGLHRVLFEPMTSEFETKVTEAVTSAVSFWLPYITIKDINIDMTDEMKDRNEAYITIQFTVNNDIDLQEITFTLRG